jgi:hypothetical protein
VFDYAQPFAAAGIRYAQGEGFKRSALPLVPNLRLAQGLWHPRPSKSYPGDRTRLGRLAREIGVVPIPENGVGGSGVYTGGAGLIGSGALGQQGVGLIGSGATRGGFFTGPGGGEFVPSGGPGEFSPSGGGVFVPDGGGAHSLSPWIPATMGSETTDPRASRMNGCGA